MNTKLLKFAPLMSESLFVGSCAKGDGPSSWIDRAVAKRIARRDRRHRQNRATLAEAWFTEVERRLAATAAREANRRLAAAVEADRGLAAFAAQETQRVLRELTSGPVPIKPCKIVHVEFRRKGGAVDRYDLKMAA